MEACLHAAGKHDNMVICEAQSQDECTEMLNASKMDGQGDMSVLHQSQMNISLIQPPSFPVDLENNDDYQGDLDKESSFL